VESGREKGDEDMGALRVPTALADRLGERGAEDLVVLLRSVRTEWSNDVLTLATERYERRLTEEVSRLRVDFAQEIGRLRADVSRELATTRVDQFKWSFAFWLGQVATTAGLLAYMLRSP
jgi:hypothetical protein